MVETGEKTKSAQEEAEVAESVRSDTDRAGSAGCPVLPSAAPGPQPNIQDWWGPRALGAQPPKDFVAKRKEVMDRESIAPLR